MRKSKIKIGIFLTVLLIFTYVVSAGDSVTDKLERGETKTYTLDSLEYTVTPIYIYTGYEPFYVKFDINDERAPYLYENDTHDIDEHTTINVIEIEVHWEGIVWEEVTFELVLESYCGDGICDSNEDCSSCSTDCGCDSDYKCQNSECVQEVNPPEEPIKEEEKNIDLSNYPHPFIKNNKANFITIIGAKASSQNVIAAMELINSLIGEEITKIEPAYLDNEIIDVFAQNTIIVGGPCRNKAAAEVMGLSYGSCGSTSTIPKNKGIIRLIEHGNGNVALLIAGYDDYETRMAASVIANYKDYSLSGKEMEIGEDDLLYDIPKPKLDEDDEEIDNETDDEVEIECEGCISQGKCFLVGASGLRDNQSVYCDGSDWTPKKELNEDCEFDYECKINSCKEGVCKEIKSKPLIVEDKSIFQRIWKWIKGIFR